MQFDWKIFVEGAVENTIKHLSEKIHNKGVLNTDL